jgi:cation transport regulator
MPYSTLSDLPLEVREALPEHGQEIFRAAYNSAWEQYKNPEDREGSDTREEVSFAVAWSAVKNVFEKKSGEWVKS